MKVFRLLFSSLALTIVFTVLAFAQTETPQNSAPNKIAAIDTDLFYDKKAGIPELAKAKKQFDAEVDPRFETEIKPKNDELDILLWKIRELNTQIQNLKDRNLDSWDKEIELGTVKSKYDLLKKETDSLIEKYKTFAEKLEAELLTPIRRNIGRAIEEFKNKKGFIIVVDISKSYNSFIITDVDDDVTTEFINYYNENFAKSKSQ